MEADAQAEGFWKVVPLGGASPGLQSGEAGFQARENVPVKLRALALVRTESADIRPKPSPWGKQGFWKVGPLPNKDLGFSPCAFALPR